MTPQYFQGPKNLLSFCFDMVFILSSLPYPLKMAASPPASYFHCCGWYEALLSSPCGSGGQYCGRHLAIPWQPPSGLASAQSHAPSPGGGHPATARHRDRPFVWHGMIPKGHLGFTAPCHFVWVFCRHCPDATHPPPPNSASFPFTGFDTLRAPNNIRTPLSSQSLLPE